MKQKPNAVAGDIEDNNKINTFYFNNSYLKGILKSFNSLSILQTKTL